MTRALFASHYTDMLCDNMLLQLLYMLKIWRLADKKRVIQRVIRDANLSTLF